jgi:ribosomal protein RSM22 (predicted rRNA methylase)
VVAAVGGAEPGSAPGAWARVLRRPAQRKGLVSLRLCNPDGTSADRIVTRRTPDLYRLARDTSWGDAFSAPPPPGRALPDIPGRAVPGHTDVPGI